MNWTYINLYRFNKSLMSCSEEEIVVPFSWKKRKAKESWIQQLLKKIERRLKCQAKKKKKQPLKD